MISYHSARLKALLPYSSVVKRMPRVTAQVRKGAPMPAALNHLISEQLFEQLRSECRAARTEAEFQMVIQRFNIEQNWHGALVGYEQRHSAFDLFFESVITLGKL